MGDNTRASRLDHLARELAAGQVSRRGALQRLAGAAAAAMVPSFLLADEALARCPPSRKCGDKCCPHGARCRKGKCKCKAGLKKCGRKCIDVSADAANCGSCGHVCSPGQTCVNGQCTGGSTGPVCGNNVAEGTEICDGADLKGATCQSLGFIGGTLKCASNCTYDTSGCVSPSCTTDADCPQGPAGDCQKAVCASGTCGFVADNSDVPVDDGNPCTNDVCVNGVPSHTIKPSGTTCGAGLVCNSSGQCVGCLGDSDCPTPSSPCQTRVCNAGTCGFANVANGQACDDGNACTLNNACQAGTCTGTPVVCAAQDQCHVAGVCDPNTGNCSNPAKADGSTCSDGNPCTQADTCQAGVCTSGSPAPAGTACTGGVCNGTGQCVACVQASDCPQPSNTCQQRTCVNNVCGTTPAANGTACTGSCFSGTCSNGTCVSGSPLPNGTPCDDGNLCTTANTCVNGTCTSGVPVQCTAQNQCHVPGTCNPSTGLCSNPTAANGTACNDGNACTQTDVCINGVCTGGNPVTCPAGQSCNPVTGLCS